MTTGCGQNINSIADLYREFYQPIFRYLYRLSGSHQAAEDLTQETFYQAVLSVYRFRGDAKVSTWLFKIARHTYLNFQKRAARDRRFRGELELEQRDPGGDTPQAVIERQELSERVQEILGDLPEDFRTVILLKEVENLSHSEIAQVMDKSVASTKVLLHRAKKRFREEFRRLEGNV